MKKRISSLILAVVMLMGILPNSIIVNSLEALDTNFSSNLENTVKSASPSSSVKSASQSSLTANNSTQSTSYPLYQRRDMTIYTTDLYKAYRAQYITDASITKTSSSITMGPYFTAEDPPSGSGIRYYATYAVDWDRLNLTTGSSTFGNDEIVWRGFLSAPDPATKVVLGAKRMDSNSYISMTDWFGEEVYVKMTSAGEIIFNLSDLNGWSVIRTKGGVYTPYVVLIDDRMPSILGYDISDDGEYLDIYFDEPVKVANKEETNLSDFTVTVKYVHSRSGVEAGELIYRGHSVKSEDYNTNRLRLYCENVPSGEFTITEILASSTPGLQNFEVLGMVQCNYYYVYNRGDQRFYEYTGHPISVIDTKGGWSPLTDLAGNTAALPGQTDVKGYNLSWDTQKPQVERISAIGSMSPNLNEKDKNSWPSDIDLSAVYAGTGDEMYFEVKFDEAIASFGTVTLNVNQNGSPVTLSSPSITTSKNANGDISTVARYGPVIFDSSYSMASGYEDKNIQVISLGSLFIDQAGNYLDNNAVVLNIAQKIYLDTEAPTVTKAQLVTGNGTNKFTIKVEMSDVGSGFLGLEGELGISVKRSDNVVSYRMAITDNINEPADNEYKYSGNLGNNTVSYHQIPLYNGERYIHVEIDKSAAVSIDDIVVQYKIPDWAGNLNLSEPIQTTPLYYYDTIAPSLTTPSIYVAYNEASAEITAAWKTTDFHSSLGVTTYYQWSDTKPANYSDGWSVTADYDATQITETGFWMTNVSEAPNINQNGDTQITLWVYARDACGNLSEMKSATTTVTLSKPAVVFNYMHNPEMPADNPTFEIGVSSNPNAAAIYKNGYVRVFINFDTENVANVSAAYEGTHMLIYSSEIFEEYANGTANLFELLEKDSKQEIDLIVPYYTVVISDDGSTFESVSSIKRSSELYELIDSWYGNMSISYDACFSDTSLPALNGDDTNYQNFLSTFEFIPRSNNALSDEIVNASYVKSGEPIAFAYSGNIDNIYTIDFGIPKNANGNELTIQSGYVSGNYESYCTELFYQTLGGVSLDFNVTNSLIGPWGVYDLDMSNSYLSVIKLGKNGGEDKVWVNIPMICENLVNDVSPYTVTFNTVKLPDMKYETGTYVLELVLTNYAGATTVKRVEDTYLVLDNEEAPEIGVWNTYITPGISLYSGLPKVVRYDENGNPILEISEYNSKAIYDTSSYVINNNLTPGIDEAISGMSVSLTGKKEVNRDELYVSESSGAENFGFTVSVLENEYKEKLQTVGAVKEFYIWNPSVHASREEGIKITGELFYSFASGNASDHSTWAYDTDNGNIGISTLNKNEDGIFDLASALGIKAGENRICMQVVMMNGNESSIEQFAISVTESTPEATLGVYPRISLAENSTNDIVWADMSINNVFSGSGIHGTYVLSKNNVILVDTKEVFDEESGNYRTIEELTEYGRYSYKNTLKVLEQGYYSDILGINSTSFGYYNQGTDQFLDKNGQPIDPEYHIHTWGSNNHYQMIPIDSDAIIRFEGDDYFNYGLTASGSGVVTDKLGEYNAAGGMLVIDESGASIFLLPQFESNSKYVDATFVDGYSPKYTINTNYLYFYENAIYTTTLFADQIWNNTITLRTSIHNYQYVDRFKSYIEFTDINGDVLARYTFDEDVSLPNSVGYEGYSQSGSSFTFDIVAPIADGINNQPGDLCDDLWAQVHLYDMNLGEYLTTDRIQLVRPDEATYSVQFTYASKTPSAGEGVYYLGEQFLHFDTSVSVESPEAYTEGWNFNWIIKNEKDYESSEVTFIDSRGNRYTETYSSTYYADNAYPYVNISTLQTTINPVIVTVTPNESWTTTGNISVQTSDQWDNNEGISWERNEETGIVTAVVTKNTYITVLWYDNEGNYVSEEFRVRNIVEPDIGIEWSYGESTEDYAHGNVTAYVVDKNKNIVIVDPMTGDVAKYTFEYGSDVTSFTWPSLRINSIDGPEIGSITAELEVELVALPEKFLPKEEYDQRQPSVQVIPYSIQGPNAVPLDIKYIFEDTEERVTDTQIDYLNPSLTAYDGFELYTDATEFSSALGWGNVFRFKIEVADVNLTKTVIKAGIDASVPTSYVSAVSDNIAGVNVMGSMIDVTANTEFTVFVIDKENNVTSIPIKISEISEVPVPEYEKTHCYDYDGIEYISVDLITPENGRDLYITKVNGENAYYAEFTVNGTHVIDYEYVYYNVKIVGQITVEITEIDETKILPPQLLNISWSANKSQQTTQDVIATLTFDKAIKSVNANDAPADLEVLVLGNKITVRYKNNTPATELFFTSIYGIQSDAVRMPEVTNIDRDPPEVTVADITLSGDGKHAIVTFEANERVSFRECGKIDTVFEKQYSENGTYDCTFIDMAGNIYKLKVTVDNIVNTRPIMSFSLSSSGVDSVLTPDELGSLNIGDTFYVSVNRDSIVSFNNESKEALANTYVEFTVGDASGGTIVARDGYGNTVSAVFTSIEYPDITPPTLVLKQYTVYGSMLDLEELDSKIKANATAIDDRDREVAVTVQYDIPTNSGEYVVTYKAQDNSGNEVTAMGKIYVYETTAPGVSIDGNIVERNSIYLAESDDMLKLIVDMQGEPYDVVYKNGIKTVAQMKIGSTELTMTDDEIILPFAGTTGYYTICITTQSHNSYVIIVYVK